MLSNPNCKKIIEGILKVTENNSLIPGIKSLKFMIRPLYPLFYAMLGFAKPVIFTKIQYYNIQ